MLAETTSDGVEPCVQINFNVLAKCRYNNLFLLSISMCCTKSTQSLKWCVFFLSKATHYEQKYLKINVLFSVYIA